MSLVTLAEAKLHLRVTDSAEDALIAVYITAAEQSAVSVVDRVIYADATAMSAAKAQAPIDLAAATVAYADAITAAESIADAVDQCQAITTAELSYVSAQADYRKSMDGILVNEAIKAAILLVIGHLYGNREDVVSGISIAKLPNGAEWLLQPYKAYH